MYYYRSPYGYTQGPVKMKELVALRRRGVLLDDVEVSEDGFTNWRQLSSVMTQAVKPGFQRPAPIGISQEERRRESHGTTGNRAGKHGGGKIEDQNSPQGLKSGALLIWRVFAALMSLLIPGLGQAMLGKPEIGVVIFILAAFLWFFGVGWIVHLGACAYALSDD